MIFSVARIQRFVAALTLLIFLCFYSLISQVTIREKAVITPTGAPVAPMAAPVSSATILTVEISFTGGIKNEPNKPHVFSMIDPCGVRTEGNFGGSITFNFPALGGAAQARAIFYPSSPGQTTVRWRVDGVDVSSSTGDVTCTNCRIDLQPSFTLYPGYTFSRTWEGIRHGESNFFSARAIDRFDFCQAPVWNPAFGITLTISRGSQYGEFVDAAGQSLGTTTTVTSEELASIRYAANGVQPDSIGTVVIEASSAGIGGTVSFTVRNSTLHLEPSPPHDVHAGEWTSVDAWVADVQGNAAEAPEGVTCTFEIVAGGTWATLVDDASGQRGSILSGIVFEEGRARVTVEASTEEPTMPQEVRVSITASDPEIARTEATVRVIPHELVLIATPSTVAQGQEAQLEVKLRLPDGSLGDVSSNNNIFFYINNYPSLDTLVSADGSQRDVFVWGDQPRATFLATADTSRLDSDRVVIVAGANEGSGIGKVLVLKKNNFDHFEIEVIPDTVATRDMVAFAEGARLFVQARDKDDKDVPLPVTALLKFSLVTNEQYGTFIDANGDTLKTTPVKLDDVSYADALAGVIRFAAVKKNPESAMSCRIRVELQSDPSKKGEKDVTVLEQTLKIVMAAPYEVQPVIPPTLVNSPRVENRKQFTVRLTRGGKPVDNHPFRLTTDYIDGSGGHDHVTPRRTQSRENYGHFFLRSITTHYDQPYDGQTQANGREEFDYVASIFGDRTRLRVESTEKPLLWDTLSVEEKLPDLQLLADGTNYVKVGGTCNHHGPSDRGVAQNCQTPDNNHWGTPILVQVVQAVADSFSATYSGSRLRINDMSLSYGGKFEINGSWNTNSDHQEHRVGKNADVSLLAYNQDGLEISLNARQRRRLWDLISDLAGRDPLDESDENHYHIQ